jgi:hypothetical protein
MSISYHARLPRGGGTTATSLDALRRDVADSRWPLGSYDVNEHT